MITFEITDVPAPSYSDLVWDIFFRQKGRGLTLTEHFPWIANRNAGIWYVHARLNGAAVGGLVVSEKRCAMGKFGIIGLVCVDPRMRGQRIASLLTQIAIDHAQKRQCEALTLWTGQPHVYASQGFAVHDSGRYGWVSRPVDISGDSRVEAFFQSCSWPSAGEAARGLPPFAVEATRIKSATSRADAIVVKDANGIIVAEWEGHNPDVEALFRTALPEKFRMNCQRKDSLPEMMATTGWTTTLLPSQLQMWCAFDTATALGAWDDASGLRLLDRI